MLIPRSLSMMLAIGFFLWIHNIGLRKVLYLYSYFAESFLPRKDNEFSNGLSVSADMKM
jgi:hypothetical protein